MAKNKEEFREEVEQARQAAAGVTAGGFRPTQSAEQMNQWMRRELDKTYRLPPETDDREES